MLTLIDAFWSSGGDRAGQLDVGDQRTVGVVSEDDGDAERAGVGLAPVASVLLEHTVHDHGAVVLPGRRVGYGEAVIDEIARVVATKPCSFVQPEPVRPDAEEVVG